MLSNFSRFYGIEEEVKEMTLVKNLEKKIGKESVKDVKNYLDEHLKIPKGHFFYEMQYTNLLFWMFYTQIYNRLYKQEKEDEI
jgi:hypothetical protein